MNIAFIATEISPSENNAFTGGLVNNVVRLSCGLTKKGHNIQIFTTDVNNYYKGKTHSYDWATIIPLSSKGGYVSLKNNIIFLIKIIPLLLKSKQEKPVDIIHVHSAYSIFGIIPTLLSFFLKIPIVFTLYSPVQIKSLGDRKGIYQLLSSGLITKLFLRRNSRIICTSQKTKESLESLGFKSDFEVIPPIVDTNLFNSRVDGLQKRDEIGIKQGSKIVLYCGSWAKWKGVDYLIKSIYNIKKDYPNIILITAWGEPYDWYNLRKTEISNLISKLQLNDNIIEFGVIKDMNKLMAASDIFVAPFLNIDGVADPPLSILEAMSCGKPVIATNIASIPKLIQDGVNGLIVNSGSVDELTDALKRLLENDYKMIDIGKNASNFIISKYGIDTIASQMIEIYNTILKENK